MTEADRTEPTSRGSAWRAVAGGALLVLVTASGLLVSPGLLGSPGAEVYGHAWVQGWHAAALPAWPTTTEGLLTEAGPWAVIDPLPTLFAAVLGRIFGGIVGYNAWILVSVFGAFLGGAWLARREGGSPLVGGLLLGSFPAFSGSLSSGLTEDGAVGLAAVALGLLRDRRPGAVVLGGLGLGLLAATGLVLAYWTALVGLLMGLHSVFEERRRLWPLAIAAAAALASALPVAALQGVRLGGEGHRLGSVVEQVEPLWRLNPWRGADLLSYFVPGPLDPGPALLHTHPGYLGLAALALAFVGGRSRWWLPLLLALLLAPGRRLSFGGAPLGLDNPAVVLLSALPGAGLLNHHGRALLLAGVALSVLAARGFARLPSRGKALFIGLIGLDLLLGRPLPVPLPVAEAAPLDVLSALGSLPAGPLLVLPAAGPGINFQRPLFDQPVHGRPLVLSPNQPGLPPAMMRSPSGRWLAGLAAEVPAPPPSPFEAPPGVAVMVVREPYVARVEAALGPPDRRGEDASAWSLTP